MRRTSTRRSGIRCKHGYSGVLRLNGARLDYQWWESPFEYSCGRLETRAISFAPRRTLV